MDSPAVKQPSDWGSEDWKAERDLYLRDWINDESAFQFLMTLSNITEFFDDLVDQDVELTGGRITQVMMEVLIGLPTNPFFSKHQVFLTPIVITAINSWLDSNILADGGRSERALAYALRNFDVQVVQAIIYITRGQAYLRGISPQLWKLFAAEQDDIIDWIEGESK